MLRLASRSVGVLLALQLACGDDSTMPTSSLGTTGTAPETTTDSTSTAPPDPTSGGDTSSGASEGATTTGGIVDPSTSSSSTDDPSSSGHDPSSTSSTTAGSSTGESGEETGGCPGAIGCDCNEQNPCDPGGTCFMGVCEMNGGNICPYEFDGKCDEPSILCPLGSDPYDCCSTEENGVCEEVGMGGECPVGTDTFDCGGCPYLNDGFCDEPFLCPAGSDKPDCCATPENGVCEELDQGGMCPEGSDYYDCGECQWANDGFCDEPDLCAPDTDGDDCCATPENGVCEEVDQGGMCPEGSDHYDCGECQWANDGFCDEPNLCAPDTDGDDCCATVKNGQCEEIGQGGMCPQGSDYYDCGECPWINDGECDEPNGTDLCPLGSDGNDC